MARWRASGSIMASGRSSMGFHMVLHCERLNAADHCLRDLPFVPFLCRDDALALKLERRLQIGDHVELTGHVEHCRRRQIPMLKRDWDFIVTQAHVPAIQNWLKRRFPF